MNRGSVRVKDDDHLLASGFNEAPIHESGKSPRPDSARARNARFNEAPIHESGK